MFRQISFHDLVRDVHFLFLDLAIEDGDARLVVRGLEVDIQPALESAAQPVREAPDLRHGPVGGEDHLLVRVVQRVERVEELLLGSLLALEELDVVDQEDVHETVLVLELVPRFLLDREDELVGECLHGHVGNLQVGKLPVDRVSDGLHEMSLSQADASVDEAGIVPGSRVRGDGQRSIRGKGVGFPDDEPLECVLLVQLRMLALARDRFFGLRCTLSRLLVTGLGRALFLNGKLHGQVVRRPAPRASLLFWGDISGRSGL